MGSASWSRRTTTQDRIVAALLDSGGGLTVRELRDEHFPELGSLAAHLSNLVRSGRVATNGRSYRRRYWATSPPSELPAGWCAVGSALRRLDGVRILGRPGLPVGRRWTATAPTGAELTLFHTVPPGDTAAACRAVDTAWPPPTWMRAGDNQLHKG
ncbi:MAG: hypothetical protein ACPGVG_17200 [Mycobacterium sp.]